MVAAGADQSNKGRMESTKVCSCCCWGRRGMGLNRTDGGMVYGSATGFKREWMVVRGRKLILGFGVRDNAYIVTTDVAKGNWA